MTEYSCVRCHHEFTSYEIEHGLIRFIKGVDICLACERNILTEWAEAREKGVTV